MRGKLGTTTPTLLFNGITPADAGKTRQIKSRESQLWDHPRGCGENLEVLFPQSGIVGSPPRMRGKLSLSHYSTKNPWITPADAGKTASCLSYTRNRKGITPADAGKTNQRQCSNRDRWDHPRGCGENAYWCAVVDAAHRITPADAGKTPPRCCAFAPPKDHPRGCGENLLLLLLLWFLAGSPPRMRGKHFSQS